MCKQKASDHSNMDMFAQDLQFGTQAKSRQFL